MPVSFHSKATDEYVAARRYYARFGPATEARFVAAVAAAIARIDANPAGGSPSYRGCRWVRLKRYPYLLHYEQIGPTHSFVYAVAHGKRRPGYWLRRRNRP